MRVQSLTLVAAGVALLAPTAPPAAAQPPHERPVSRGASRVPQGDARLPRSDARLPRGDARPTRSEGRVSAAELLARVRGCAQVSRGRYRTDAAAPADVPVCATRGAVYWKADLDIDCDGRPTARCNRRTDPSFSAGTAYQQSDGRHLAAERLPYIVVPAPSRVWDHRDQGIRGGSVAAVIYRGRVQYAVVGDTGPRDIIGEASYATAQRLGIHSDPRGGGAASGVTYIVFRNTRVTPIEDHRSAVSTGERAARRLVRHGD
ncbi:glycoside hydrolase family 75 protein [Streptomyces sp. NPDC090108]|uniref:glycoside hydrolase family 75 protein n=1 Tax=Streptomyces sp. NPDC090108 TaxID=3365947 RepID=UPI003812DABE